MKPLTIDERVELQITVNWTIDAWLAERRWDGREARVDLQKAVNQTIQGWLSER